MLSLAQKIIGWKRVICATSMYNSGLHPSESAYFFTRLKKSSVAVPRLVSDEHTIRAN
jgi:hypothetical protein